MAKDESPRVWGSGIAASLLVLVITIAFLVLQKKTAGLERKKKIQRGTTSLESWKILKQHTLRIDEIPSDKSHEALQGDLERLVENNPGLKEGVSRIVPHFLGRRHQNIACATATFHTSISADDLAKKMTEAGVYHPYRFDADFLGVTPLYESPDGADVE